MQIRWLTKRRISIDTQSLITPQTKAFQTLSKLYPVQKENNISWFTQTLYIGIFTSAISIIWITTIGETTSQWWGCFPKSNLFERWHVTNQNESTTPKKKPCSHITTLLNKFSHKFQKNNFQITHTHPYTHSMVVAIIACFFKNKKSFVKC
jgi:hypothetical protein